MFLRVSVNLLFHIKHAKCWGNLNAWPAPITWMSVPYCNQNCNAMKIGEFLVKTENLARKQGSVRMSHISSQSSLLQAIVSEEHAKLLICEYQAFHAFLQGDVSVRDTTPPNSVPHRFLPVSALACIDTQATTRMTVYPTRGARRLFSGDMVTWRSNLSSPGSPLSALPVMVCTNHFMNGRTGDGRRLFCLPSHLLGEKKRSSSRTR
mmetsp:Transcript_41249/g.103990  ORF Transcript_41249/g.103990 Transcript_41249/m.103990 type:complete len:207 (+) Transcript_41249:2983-3603(+)